MMNYNNNNNNNNSGISAIKLLPTPEEVEEKKNGRRKKKVPLPPGHSQLDWMRKQQQMPPLGGVGHVTPSELQKHNKEDDAWTVFRGKVYNITDYLNFHPGGKPELMRAAGMDCTEMFNFRHDWVNFESMLLKYFIGYLVPEATGSVSQE
ncbi:cytochrome b5 domain-containing protein [Tieghemostelium lacteum]|uniref:Cytochrome b5 domain-containing protein n=1 Tax=Tieghemostelium lacteum TaxID=361077 RepID=A0A151ZIE4_TIELA|nr:cytochrome b5 domain-containing protein [Tieghemostelium lacteum]|eukprot:KYQ93650.1 cytochrome b5 domain-containing protein [Tieghemostelium lacteum]